jgi:hypothetical protein
MNRKLTIQSLRTVMLLGLVTISAGASTITYTSLTDPAVIGVGLHGTELIGAPPDVISFPKWNPADFAGQTLTGVSFKLDGHIEGTITLQNNNPDQSTQIQGTTNVEMTLGDNLVVIFPTYTTGKKTIPKKSSQTFTNLSGDASDTSGLITTGLGAYKGNGYFDLGVGTLSGIAFLGGGGFAGGSQETYASAEGEVTYYFEESQTVPEPGTLLLMGGPFVIIGLLKRRAKA